MDILFTLVRTPFALVGNPYALVGNLLALVGIPFTPERILFTAKGFPTEAN